MIGLGALQPERETRGFRDPLFGRGSRVKVPISWEAVAGVAL
jgi:hypothetical protein